MALFHGELFNFSIFGSPRRVHRFQWMQNHGECGNCHLLIISCRPKICSTRKKMEMQSATAAWATLWARSLVCFALENSEPKTDTSYAVQLVQLVQLVQVVGCSAVALSWWWWHSRHNISQRPCGRLFHCRVELLDVAWLGWAVMCRLQVGLFCGDFCR